MITKNGDSIMIFGLILAGGIGRRMSSDIPKQYLNIGGRAIISHTIACFSDNDDFDKVIVLTPSDWIDYTKKVIKSDIENTNKIEVIEGGELRNDTIMNGIDYIEKNYGLDDSTIVVTHDAVRPFVTKEILDSNIEALKKYSSCDTVVPATDTIIASLDGEYIDNVPDRATLYQGQTPQSFRAKMFKELYNSLTVEEKSILTDAAKVFVIKGEKVALVEGSQTNIKITYPADLLIAESILGGDKS